MALGIVQLSDLHLSASGANPVLTRVQQIKAALQSLVHEIDELLLIITGDVAYSGSQEEYDLATGFVADLEKVIGELNGVRLLGVAVLPGNHDCDFRNEGDIRPVLVSSIGAHIDGVEAGSDAVAQVLQVQDSFFEFEELLSGQKRQGPARLFWTKEIIFSGGTLLLRVLNTAWLSRAKEVGGQLQYPVQLLPQEAPIHAALVVTAFHHPYGWLQPDSARALRRNVETTSDIVLTGHEHDGDSYSKSGPGGTTNYVEGMALQASDVTTGFNFIKIDLVGQTYQVHSFPWQRGSYTASSVHSAMFTRNQRLLDHQFVPNSDFRAELQDIGTPFTHPVKKQDLKLRDLFVYPDLRVTTMRGSTSAADALVTSGDVLDYVATHPLMSVAGAPAAGKTSLAKTLCAELREQKRLVPVILRFDDFRGTNPPRVVRTLERAVEAQYSLSKVERFKQLEPESKVILIDDWHRVRFNLKGKAQILSTLRKMSDRIILFTDDATVFEQLVEAAEHEAFANFVHCEIKQFGYRLRGDLVTKWHTLGREFEIEEAELTHQVAVSENLLDTLIGKGIVPSFPLFIFSVLQAHEGAGANNLAYGSYGHIYEALLTNRMARVSKKNLGLKYTYLSLIAYQLFKSQRQAITSVALTELHRKYEVDYGISVDQEQLLRELLEAQILSPASDGVKFHYRAAYYFFVAKYFQEGVANVTGAATLQQELRQMADMAHDEENAHIIIFYVYLTKDRPLIEHILANSKKIFATFPPANLDEDVAFVNKVLPSSPKLLAPSNAEVAQSRVEYRRQRDEAEQEGADEPSAVEKTSYTEDIAETIKIDFAFKNLQIMGQVLRNFPGELRGDLKLNLAQESYGLALRTLRSFLRALETNLDEVREYMFRQLKVHQAFARRGEDELRAAADAALVALAQVGIFGIIKKVSSSVGLEDLRDIYGAVRKQAGEENVPVRLIDLSIWLDHFAKIPEDDVKDLEQRLRGNVLAYTTLRLLVAEFLYLFPCEFRLRQRIMQLLHFDPTTGLGAQKLVRGVVKELKSG